MSGNLTRSGSFRDIVRPHGKEEKWWLPVPCVSPAGLSEKSKKLLRQKRSCTNQIHKAAMAINNCILADMEIPESYMASLPKVGSCLIENPNDSNLRENSPFHHFLKPHTFFG